MLNGHYIAAQSGTQFQMPNTAHRSIAQWPNPLAIGQKPNARFRIPITKYRTLTTERRTHRSRARVPPSRTLDQNSELDSEYQYRTANTETEHRAPNTQVQRKGSFLSRSGSLLARSGSLASGKTTVSASKFVFMSSIASTDDSCARTGFEEPAARDSSSVGGLSLIHI